MKLIIILLLSLVLLAGCPPYYADGSCGSLCINKECLKEDSGCGYNWLNELLRPTQTVQEYCFEKCYDKEDEE